MTEWLLVPLAYFLGSISSAIIVCKLMGFPDPRGEGSGNPGATNVLRIGGKKVFGSYTFHEAAYIGGISSIRGFRRERFAGDASIYGNFELRVTLGKALFILPGEYGVFGLADVGRVYFKEESSKKWHPAVGGGIFFSIFDYSTVFSLAIARCEEKTSVYLKGGFSF